jgi:serine/threonine-protein kinase
MIHRDVRRCPSCGQRFGPDAAFCPFDGIKLEPAPFDPGTDVLPGATRDGRYELIEVLGEGGMGRVYKVRHVALERTFAMKVLRRELATDEGLVTRFLDEVRATAAVTHPNVVQIMDCGVLTSGAPYFVMELLLGTTLRQILNGGPLSIERGIPIVRRVAAALGAAHAARVIHRDLKPDNVFVLDARLEGVPSSRPPEPMLGAPAAVDVRVVDFGASKIVGSSRITRTGVVFGTPHYMSPEQATGDSVDHRTDIYALGVIMYEMFTGRRPFDAETYMGVLTQHMFVAPIPPTEAGPQARGLGQIQDVILTCMAKKAEDRFASMREVVVALDRAATPVRTASRAEGASDPAPGPPDRSMGIDAVRLRAHPPRHATRLALSAAATAVLVLAGMGWACARCFSAEAGTSSPSQSSSPSSAPATSAGPSPPNRSDPDVPAAQPAAPVTLAQPETPSDAIAPSSASARRAAEPPARHLPSRALDDVGDPFAERPR